MKLLQKYRAWRLRWVEGEAAYWRDEANRCALLAHQLDPMREPMRWGRLQNRVLWARHNERAAIAKEAARAKP